MPPFLFRVRPQGLEPQLTEPESVVLPITPRAICASQFICAHQLVKRKTCGYAFESMLKFYLDCVVCNHGRCHIMDNIS